MPDNFGYDEMEKFFGKIRVEPGLFRQDSKPVYLFFFPILIRRCKAVSGLEFPDLLGDFKTFREDMDQCRINIVDTVPVGRQNLILLFSFQVVVFGQ